MPNTPRARAVGGRREAPEVAMDYCFLSKDTAPESSTVLVLKDRDSRATILHPVLCKVRLRSDA
eukprot:15474994-Alexandrium_andersonii.AAC.1